MLVTPGHNVLVYAHDGVVEAIVLRVEGQVLVYAHVGGTHGYGYAEEGRVAICDRGITWAPAWREDEASAFRVARSLT